tara:strand:- start:29 stop:163 length:135 start_codon:yes stop_codon:yes gene_type:complete
MVVHKLSRIVIFLMEELTKMRHIDVPHGELLVDLMVYGKIPRTL